MGFLQKKRGGSKSKREKVQTRKKIGEGVGERGNVWKMFWPIFFVVVVLFIWYEWVGKSCQRKGEEQERRQRSQRGGARGMKMKSRVSISQGAFRGELLEGE